MDAAVAATVVGLAAVVLAILALATATGRTDVPSFAEYLRGWRDVHGLEPDRMSGGLVDAYLRLPYAIARPLARRGVRPNVVTLVGLLVALASVPPYLAGGAWPALGAVAALGAGLCDQLDGAVAVLSRRTTTFGAIWDSAVDRVADLALLAGPAVWLATTLAGETRAWGLTGIAVAGAGLFLLEFTRARCQAVGYVTDQIVTPAERPTRVIVAVVLGLGSGVAGPRVWVWGAWGLGTLTLVSVVILLADAARRDDPATPTTSASG